MDINTMVCGLADTDGIRYSCESDCLIIKASAPQAALLNIQCREISCVTFLFKITLLAG